MWTQTSLLNVGLLSQLLSLTRFRESHGSLRRLFTIDSSFVLLVISVVGDDFNGGNDSIGGHDSTGGDGSVRGDDSVGTSSVSALSISLDGLISTENNNCPYEAGEKIFFKILTSVREVQKLVYWVFWFSVFWNVSLGDFLLAPADPRAS